MVKRTAMKEKKKTSGVENAVVEKLLPKIPDEDEEVFSELEDVDDEAGDLELRVHENLMSLVRSGKKTGILSGDGDDIGGDGRGPTGEEDVFRVTTDERVSLGDMVGALDGMVTFGELKKKLERVEKRGRPLEVPGTRVETERMDRDVGYQRVKKDVSQWQSLVKKNREAEKLSFPMNEMPRQTPSVSHLTATFEPMNNFEKEIQDVLERSGVADERKIAEAETLELNKLSKEEVMRRKRELAKMRSLLFFHEKTLKRVRKIKSKKFRKVHKKEKEMSKIEGISDLGDDAARALQRERDRAEERMSLRHRNTTKWVKRKLLRGEAQFNEGTRAAIEEQLRRGEELKAKVASRGDDSDEDSADSADEEIHKESAEAPSLPEKGLFALPFMKRAIENKKIAASREDEDANDEEESTLGRKSGRRKFSPSEGEGRAQKGAESEDQEDQDDEAKVLKQRLKAERHTSPGPPRESDGFTTRTGGRLHVAEKTKSTGVREADPTIWMNEARRRPIGSDEQVAKILGAGREPNGALLLAKDDAKRRENAKLVRDAFEGVGEEAEEFEKMKADAIDSELPSAKDLGIDEALPGWGSWSGKGARPSRGETRYAEQARAKIEEARLQAIKRRRDSSLNHVILNEKRWKGASRLSLPAAPFPYRSRELYEASLATPLGKEWQTPTTFKKGIASRVKAKAGSVIDPIRFGGSKGKAWEQHRRPLA